MNLCVCGRQRASVGDLDYCTGCHAHICSCVVRPSQRGDLRSSALLVFLTYTETKRRLRPTRPAEDAAYFDALDEVRRYVTQLTEPGAAS